MSSQYAIPNIKNNIVGRSCTWVCACTPGISHKQALLSFSPWCLHLLFYLDPPDKRLSVWVLHSRGGRCRSRFTCPGFAISGTELTYCWAEVFQFYRASGSGALRVGDVIGVHYPYEPRKWLSCCNNVDCGKSTCPGTPSTTHGFENQA